MLFSRQRLEYKEPIECSQFASRESESPANDMHAVNPRDKRPTTTSSQVSASQPVLSPPPVKTLPSWDSSSFRGFSICLWRLPSLSSSFRLTFRCRLQGV
jgi:hypothetical protein